MNEELQISSEVLDKHLVLRLIGDITKTSGELLLKYRNWEEEAECNTLIIDFSKVNYINSAGIAYLIRMSRLLHEAKTTTRAFGLEYHYEKMFQIVGLTKYITIFPSEWAANE